MADDVKAKQTNGIAKEVSSSTDGAVEEPDSSPVSGNCSAYMSDEEGVSRNAEVNSDTYSADVSLVSSDDSDLGGKCGSGDFVDLPWTRKRTFLERVQNKELTPDELMTLISRDKEVVDNVDQKGDGYGAIHYIAEGKYRFKTELLVVLTIYGHANLDLTTTHKDQVTALHLAVQVNDLECVQTLISLGANFNQQDDMGRTPLDVAKMQANQIRESKVQMDKFEAGQMMVVGKKMITDKGLTRTVELSASSVTFESESSFIEKRVTSDISDNSMIELLKLVGATTGSPTSREEDLMSSLIRLNSTPATAATPARDDSEQAAAFSAPSNRVAGDGCSENYCKTYSMLSSRISEKLDDVSRTLTSEEALQLVEDLRQREQFKRKYGSRILCLDGGGIRGLVTLCILQEIERKMNKSITEIFDWIVGTSTGGIIALGLCYGPKGTGAKNVRQLRDLYWSKKKNVFRPSHVLLKKSDETAKELESTLKEWLGEDIVMERTSSTCDGTTASCTKPKPKLLISAVHKKNDIELHFFNDCFSNDYSGELVWKVARYTSANFMHFTEFEDYIDGGVLANNPAEEGLTAIQDHYHSKGEKLPISLLVSIGSGINPLKEIGSVSVHRIHAINPTRWKNLLELFNSVVSVMNRRVHTNCESRCREQGIGYFRFNPELDNGVDADQIQTRKLLSMLWETKKYLHQEKETMDKLVELLKQSSFNTP